jgi:uncharacterized protein
MADTPAVTVETTARRRGRSGVRLLVVGLILLILLGVPWWTLLSAGTAWPTAVVIAGTVAFAAAFVGLPVTMMLGHGRRHRDWAAVIGDTLLGAVWVLFVWTVLAQLLRVALLLAGIDDPARSRIVAAAVVVVVAVLLVWGHVEAMRLPRTKHVDVVGAGRRPCQRDRRRRRLPCR